MNHRLRLKNLLGTMRADKLDAMIVTHAADVRYLSGFTGSNAALLVLGKVGRVASHLYTDGRYTAQARAEVQGSRVHIVQRPVLVEAAAAAEANGVTFCGFDSGATTVAMLDLMQATVLSAGRTRKEAVKLFRPVSGPVSQLRMLKDDDEAAILRRAAVMGCELYEGMLSFIEAGMREVDVAAELEFRARRAGAEGMSFETIVASGLRSSLPHGRATLNQLQEGNLLTLDFGIILEGYCSDMTRTVFLGRQSRSGSKSEEAKETEQRRVFEAVLLAQSRAVEAVRSGVTCHDVDQAARSVLHAAGLGKAFTHSTGHGLGLEIHEGPRVAAKQEQVLQAGMVITIEPGAYLPGKFGVRIEDTVLVTETGCEVLTPAFKGWTEL